MVLNQIKSMLGLSICVAVVLSLGCADIRPGELPTAPKVDLSGPTYKVIFATTGNRDPKIFVGQVQNAVTVQDALQASGALEKFKGMRVDLARVVESGRVLKLPVLFDAKTRETLPEQNYALHPGDEILVRREDPGLFADVFESLK